MRAKPTRLTIARPAVAAVAIGLLASVSAFAMTSQQNRTDARLQEHADAAALAGVNAMVAASALSDSAKGDAALIAARSALAATQMTVRDVAASPAAMSVQVRIGSGKGADISAVARYIPPADAIAPQQSSSLKLTRAANRTPL